MASGNFNDKKGPMFEKQCELCKRNFPRLGAKGDSGLLGVLAGALLAGGTSKYCPECRKSLQEQGKPVDKGIGFRCAWCGAVILILLLLVSC